MVIRVDVGVLSTQKRQKYPYFRVLDWNQIPLYTIMRVGFYEFNQPFDRFKEVNYSPSRRGAIELPFKKINDLAQITPLTIIIDYTTGY